MTHHIQLAGCLVAPLIGSRPFAPIRAMTPRHAALYDRYRRETMRRVEAGELDADIVAKDLSDVRRAISARDADLESLMTWFAK